MAQQQLKFTSSQLIKLFQTKKMKQAKKYIQQINDKNPNAEQAVNKALYTTLVQHKATPTAIATSLAFYKNILVSAQLDYFQDSQYFSQKIHQAVESVCKYNFKQQPQQRGTNYFIQKLKLASTDQNKRMGVTFVLLALQIITQFAHWYPKDYFQSYKAPSRFSKSYETLQKQGIKFPKYGQILVMKAEDKGNFQKNYKQWIKKAQQIQSIDTKRPQDNKPSPAKQKPPVQSTINNKMQKQPPKKVLASSQIKQIKPSVKAQHKIEVKPEQKQSKNEIGPVNPKVIQSKQVQKHKPMVIEKKDQSSKKDLMALVNDKKIASNVNDKKKESNVQQSKIVDQPKIKQNIEKPKTVVKQKQSKTSEIKPQTKEVSKQSEKKLLNIPPLEIQSKSNEKQKINNQDISNKPVNFILNQQIKSEENSIKKSQKPNIIPDSPSKNAIKKIIQQQRSNLSHKNQDKIVDSLLNKIQNLENQNRFLQKTLKQQSVDRFSGSKFYSEQRKQISSSPKKLMKMQHHSDYMNKILQSEPYVKTKRSLPKTERRNIHNYQKELANNYISQKLQGQYQINHFPSQSGLKIFSEKNKTLSNFRSQRHNKFEGGIYKASSFIGDPFSHKSYSSNLLKAIINLKLDEYQIPFLPQYFQPVKLQHKRLRQSALHLAGCTQSGSSQVFYQDNDIQVRLIKSSSKGVYVLSFKNIGHRNILIEYRYKQMGKLPHYNHIKMMTQNSSRWDLQSGKYLDVNFEFRISDLNFKFLQLLFHISNKPVCLFLPITLLDQCQISKRISLQKLGSFAQLHGKIIKSQPFIIKSSKLPQFMTNHSGLSNNQEMKLKGQFAITLKARNSQFNEFRHLDFYLVNLQGMSNKCQINTIIDSRLHDNEDFAKVMIQLIVFLLASTR